MIKQIKQFWDWTKKTAKRFKKWIYTALGIGGTAIVLAALINPVVIPSEIINGVLIEFPYTDENSGEVFDSRTDKMEYGFWEEGIIYKRLENKSGKAQTITSNIFTTEGVELLGVSVLEKDVAYQITVDDYKTVKYDCSNATSTQTCEKEELIGNHQETRYKDVWNPFVLETYYQQEYDSLVALKEITLKDKKGIDKPTKTIEFLLDKNEVKIFQIRIKVPKKTEGQVVFEDLGSEGGMSLLDPWYNSSWTYRRQIDIDPSKIDDDLTNFPVAVIVATTTVDFSKFKDLGEDVRFTSSDGETLIDFEQPRYASTTDGAIWWVEIPSVSSSTAATTTFYLYYGNAGASSVATTTGVWNSDFTGAFHLEEGNANAIDSTGNNTLTKTGTIVQETGKVGKAVSGFEAHTNFLAKDTNATVFTAGDNDKTILLSAYIATLPSATEYTMAFAGEYDPGNVMFFLLKESSGDYLKCALHTYDVDEAYTMATNTWERLVVVYTASNDTSTFYADGALIGSGVHSGASDFENAAIAIGSNSYTGGAGHSYVFPGILDETFFYNAAATAEWIKADYNSVNNTLLSIGAEEEEEAVRRIMIIE